MSAYIAAFNSLLPCRFKTEQISGITALEFVSGEFETDPTSDYFPNRSDLKIMRPEVIASILVTNALIKKLPAGFNLENSGLFVASGVFIEKSDEHLQQVMKIFEDYEGLANRTERMHKLYRASPPLLALQTLTNSCMSFISQYTGIKGNNATYGTTSSAGFMALEQAVKEAVYRRTSSFVCAANCAGPISALMNMAFKQNTAGWKESAAAASVLIVPENSGLTPVAKISLPAVKNNDPVHGEEGQNISGILDTLVSKAECTIISGAFTPSENEQLQKAPDPRHQPVTSFFDMLGNTGPVNLLVSMGIALEYLAAKKFSQVDLVDRDVYGRFSIIRLEAC
jgi:hypothetical protein